MDSKIILQRLAERHNITALNDMQLRMQADNSPRAILLAPTGSGKTVGFAYACFAGSQRRKVIYRLWCSRHHASW